MKKTHLLAGALLLLAGAGSVKVYEHFIAPRPAVIPAAGPIDVGFAQSMNIHHDQAVVMSQIMLNRGNSKLVGLAKSIETAQLLEIGQMKGWLLLWDKPLLPAKSGMDWMQLGKTPPDAALAKYLLDCRSTPGGMPGLATTDQLNQLRKLKGDERDRLFLQLMISHHEGALPMARFAALNAETLAVRTLATQMFMHQTEELGAMTLMLRARTAQN